MVKRITKKCHPGPFEATRKGHKPFEIRVEDDVRFDVGDELELREWTPPEFPGRSPAGYTGRTLVAKITHVERLSTWIAGAPPEAVVLGLASKEFAVAATTDAKLKADRALVKRIDEYGKNLSPWEVEFVEELTRRVVQGTLTDRQRGIAERIERERVR